MSMLCGTRLRGDFSFAPENILALDRAAIGVNSPMNNPAAADRSVIDQDKATERWNAIVIIQHNRGARLNRQAADFVTRELIGLCRAPFESRGIHELIERHDP